jgi:hypothetical protein
MAKCTRLYNDGSQITEIRETINEVTGWLTYNKTFRPGTALFVDGKLMETGLYISKERCLEFEKKLQKR